MSVEKCQPETVDSFENCQAKGEMMKSFDEVTKALSICGRHPDCGGCPYENVSYPTEIGNTCKDIMHYDALYYMQDQIDKCQEENSPLTWDELKQMEGRPVWIESESVSVGVSPYWKDWYIIKSFSNDEFMYCNDGYEWAKETQGRLWQAYRKERE